MVKAVLFLEGGGTGKDSLSRCREGFRKLLENAGLRGNMPKLVACGGRDDAYKDFCRELREQARRHTNEGYIGLLVDSEQPVSGSHLDKPWLHAQEFDTWSRPQGVDDAQLLFMTTSMETWIIADQAALRTYFPELQSNALPSTELENRLPSEILRALQQATHNSTKSYTKGRIAFEVLGSLNADVLAQRLPSFARVRRILDEKLGAPSRR